MVTLPLCLEPGGEPSFRGLLGGLMTIPGGRLSKCPRRDCPLTTLRRSNPGFHARAFILFSHQHNESANEGTDEKCRDSRCEDEAEARLGLGLVSIGSLLGVDEDRHRRRSPKRAGLHRLLDDARRHFTEQVPLTSKDWFGDFLMTRGVQVLKAAVSKQDFFVERDGARA
jgi:hypothetical protein